MSDPQGHDVRQLTSADVGLLEQLLTVFAEAFEDEETYGKSRPDHAYLAGLLAGDSFIAIVAQEGGRVIGGLAAYELRKFEQKRSEIYLYDLAVAAAHRRRGTATALIRELQRVARARGAYVVYVQADLGDEPAIALYTKLGVREDVLHFDLVAEGPTLLAL